MASSDKSVITAGLKAVVVFTETAEIATTTLEIMSLEGRVCEFYGNGRNQVIMSSFLVVSTFTSSSK